MGEFYTNQRMNAELKAFRLSGATRIFLLLFHYRYQLPGAFSFQEGSFPRVGGTLNLFVQLLNAMSSAGGTRFCRHANINVYDTFFFLLFVVFFFAFPVKIDTARKVHPWRTRSASSRQMKPEAHRGPTSVRQPEHAGKNNNHSLNTS